MVRFRAIVAFDPAIDAATFASDCRDWGIDTPILSLDFFRDRRMSDAIIAEGLRTWLNVPVLFRPADLRVHPERYAVTSWGRRAEADWLQMACPSREETLDLLVDELRSVLGWLRPAVVSLDFIRHFVFWEQVDLDGSPLSIEDGCYCEACLIRFQRETGETVRTGTSDPVSAAAYLRGDLAQRWGEWKCQRIAEVADRMFAEIRSLAPEAMLAIKTVPWRDSDLGGALRLAAGQDITRLCRDVDLVVPMAFTNILRRTPEWKRDLLAHMKATTAKPMLAYVQTEALPGGTPITSAQFSAELTTAMGSEYAGLIMFHYGQLVVDATKRDLVRSRLR